MQECITIHSVQFLIQQLHAKIHINIYNIQNTTYTHTQILDITLTNTYITYKIAHENQHTTQNIGMRMYTGAKYDVVY